VKFDIIPPQVLRLIQIKDPSVLTEQKIKGKKKKRFVLTTKRLHLTFSYETKIILNLHLLEE